MPGHSLTDKNDLERRLRDLENRLARVMSFSSAGGNWVFSNSIVITGSLTGTSFTLNYSDLIEASCVLVMRRQILKPGVDFTVVGAVLTTVQAPFRVSDVSPTPSFDMFWMQMAMRVL